MIRRLLASIAALGAGGYKGPALAPLGEGRSRLLSARKPRRQRYPSKLARRIERANRDCYSTALATALASKPKRKRRVTGAQKRKRRLAELRPMRELARQTAAALQAMAGGAA